MSIDEMFDWLNLTIKTDPVFKGLFLIVVIMAYLKLSDMEAKERLKKDEEKKESA